MAKVATMSFAVFVNAAGNRYAYEECAQDHHARERSSGNRKTPSRCHDAFLF